MENESFVTVAAAAEHLSRSTEQIRRYLREGRLPGRRIGGQWFIEQDALQAFVPSLREERQFLDRLRLTAAPDPCAHIIGIGRSGGASIADGKGAYRQANWWRR